MHGKRRWVSADNRKIRGENWFAVYRDQFLNVLGIDWAEFGDDIGTLEQIALARDDIFHHPDLWTVDISQSTHHFNKYTETFFADERYLEYYRRTGQVFIGDTWKIDVSPGRMHRAIDLTDAFCQFMEGKWGSWLG